ncbi:MAG: metallophosphoesterase [Oscillospiraceae bacterium]|nr:metallophosphoesterase [Oscillospiraceae bacterium]
MNTPPRAKLFAIADIHLSLGTDKPMNIFKGWENHTERLEVGWNSVVSKSDTVVIAGDISWAMSFIQAKADFDFINNRLNGSKIIIKGNHDYWWNTSAKMDSFLMENSFDSIRILHNNAFLVSETAVCGSRGWINDNSQFTMHNAQLSHDVKILQREAGRLEASITDGIENGGKPIVFMHYPPIYAADENPYIIEVLKKYKIKRCYYGHIHSSGRSMAFTGERYGIKFALIAADSVNFTPVLIK